MRLLLVCPDSPYPPRDGGSLRIVNLARSLAQHASVMLLTYVISPSEANALAELERTCNIQIRSVQRPARRNTLARALHKLQYYYGSYLFTSLPGPVRFNQRPVLREALLSALYDYAPDVIIWEYWFMTGFAKLMRTAYPHTVQLADAIDLEWLRLEREAQLKSGIARGWIQYIQPRIRDYTLDQYRQMTGVTFLTESDAQVTQRALPDFKRGIVLPMGLMPNEYLTLDSRPLPDRLLFFGSFRHQPNVDALRFLLENIWPLIRQARPQTRLDVMGSSMPAWMEQTAQHLPGVRALGFQSNIRPALAEASVVVAPLRFGSGVKIKILEAMAMGKAVVTTSIGAEGIDAQPGRDFIVANDAQSIAAETIRLLEDPQIRDNLGKNARQFIQAHHDADQIAANFLVQLKELATRHQATR